MNKYTEHKIESHIHTFTHTYNICIHVTHTHTHTHTHAHMHTHMHTRIHARTHAVTLPTHIQYITFNCAKLHIYKCDHFKLLVLYWFQYVHIIITSKHSCYIVQYLSYSSHICQQQQQI